MVFHILCEHYHVILQLGHHQPYKHSGIKGEMSISEEDENLLEEHGVRNILLAFLFGGGRDWSQGHTDTRQ